MRLIWRLERTSKMNKRKLNLGCGNRKLEDYLNVDKYGNPDMIVDLEKFPWPWKDNSFDKISLIHVLEHLGKDSETFLNIFKELYRVSSPNALINIVVPDPRSDAYLEDPTHVRPITPKLLELFSKEKNEMCQKEGMANSPLANYLGIDFEVIECKIIFDKKWKNEYDQGRFTYDFIMNYAREHNNVIFKYEMVLKTIK